LARFNGSIAASMAQLDVERIGREIAMGGRTSASVAYLTEAQSRFEEAAIPIEAIWTNATNRIEGFMLNIGTKVMEYGSTFFSNIPIVNDALKKLANMGDTSVPAWQSFLSDVSEGRHMSAAERASSTEIRR